MTKTNAFPALALLVLIISLLGVSPGARADSDVSQKQIRTWIDQLGHPSYDVRQHAEDALIDAGQKAVRFLKQAQDRTDLTPEARLRIKNIRHAIHLKSTGYGRSVNGLALGLYTPTDTLRFGEKAIFVLTAKNTSDHPLRVYTGTTAAGSTFQNGTAFCQLDQVGLKTTRTVQKVQWNVGICGTGAKPVFLHLDPGQTRSYTYQLHYTRSKKGTRRLEILKKNGRQGVAHPYLNVPAEGTVQLGVQHSQEEKLGRKSNDWTGSVSSKPVEIELVSRTE